MDNGKYQEAENYRKNKHYEQASLIFAEIWQAAPDIRVGWRYAECLRKTGHLQQAEQVARQAMSIYPNDTFVPKQLGWILQANEQFSDAADVFAPLWESTNDEYIIGSYILCLRKAGRLDEALDVGYQAMEQYPANKDLANKFIWVIYDKKLKPAKEDSDLDAILEAANEIMSLEPDALALKKTVLAVMKVAKDQNNAKWPVVLEWANKVDAEVFDTIPNEYDGKQTLPDRETYYIGRSRALLEMKEFEDAIQQAQQGLLDFPKSFFLARLEALAQATMGDVEGAAAKMRELQKHSRCDWYAKAELADMEYRLGNYQEAYRLMCNALESTRQGPEYKLGHLVTLANIALALDKPHISAAHVQLARVVRTTRDWNIPNELIQVENAVLEAFESRGEAPPNLPDDEYDLARLCAKYWREGSSDGFQRKKGVLLAPYPDKKFTFIKPNDGTEKIFVLLRNLPPKCREGMQVDFAIKPSFDHSKNRESFEATDVRLIR